MTKKELRALGMAGLNWLQNSQDVKMAKQEFIFQQLTSSSYWKESKTIGLTKSMPFELCTEELFHLGWAADKRLVVPKVSGLDLCFHEVEASSEFQSSDFGIQEPLESREVFLKEIDLLLVPGLIFKLDGYRVGFGGGYYDRILQNFQGKSCSLVFSEQIQESWLAESFDQPVKKLFIA